MDIRDFYDEEELTAAEHRAKESGRCGPLRYGGPCWLMPGHEGPHHCYEKDIMAVILAVIEDMREF